MRHKGIFYENKITIIQPVLHEVSLNGSFVMFPKKRSFKVFLYIIVNKILTRKPYVKRLRNCSFCRAKTGVTKNLKVPATTFPK